MASFCASCPISLQCLAGRLRFKYWCYNCHQLILHEPPRYVACRAEDARRLGARPRTCSVCLIREKRVYFAVTGEHDER